MYEMYIFEEITSSIECLILSYKLRVCLLHVGESRVEESLSTGN